MATRTVDSFTSPLNTTQALIASGIGAVSFPVMLGLNQLGLKSLGISTGSPLHIASAVGGLSVTLASLVASTAIVKSYSLSRGLLNKDYNSRTEINFSASDLLVSTASGVVFFRALGGRFSSVVPSHLYHPGAFARQWIPANPDSRANGVRKEIIERIGKEHGCHSCGSRKYYLDRKGIHSYERHYADHQPPTFFVNAKAKENANYKGFNSIQRFLPHCPRCSNRQGACLRSNGDKMSPVTVHWSSFRLYHAYLPTSIIIFLLKSNLYGSPVTHIKAPNSHQEGSSKKDDATSVAVTNEAEAMVSDRNVDLSGLVTNFPLLIVWHKLVTFIDSFPPVGSFHMTVWIFSIIAALGTL